MGGRDQWRPVVITASLGVSIVVFTLLLKVSTLFITIPDTFWKIFSGTIILLFGISSLLPAWWARVAKFLGLASGSHRWLSGASKKSGRGGHILLGAALGPTFASCSPVYFLILATVLPANFLHGLIALLAYGAGLATILFLIAFFGQKLVTRLRWSADPRGIFRRSLGVLFLLVGVAILLGWDKTAEAWVIRQGFFDVTGVEDRLLESLD